ncbi:MAG: hydroxylamine reductase [Spirochaetaceae bacterium]|nr:MAG: hydroxylamine reductase [Spirochaetaceae bacterium]
MSMFCFQCQETAKNTGCTVRGVCGKQESTANLQDVLVYAARGLALAVDLAGAGASGGAGPKGSSIDDETVRVVGRTVLRALFTTVTNVSFDDDRLAAMIGEVLAQKKRVLTSISAEALSELPRPARWSADAQDRAALYAMIPEASPKADANEDTRALRELTIYGLKGIAAYGDHALVLGYEDIALYREIIRILAATLTLSDQGELTTLVVDTGHAAVRVMELLDRANTGTYGNPEVTEVNLGVRSNPGILISGHDLKDMHELLEQTKGTGVDVYTHGEMLPANYYPTFKKYDHFVGNYGNSWWLQDKEFAAFNGPILMTTNCLTPPKESYKERIFTTGLVAFPGVKHISDRGEGSGATKDFSAVIEMAKSCPAPTELEQGAITGGFAHAQVTALADKVVDAVKSGAIRTFVVMGGCDGRQKGRNYFTDVAKALPNDTVILTAGCAKFRYNKLELGDINGIPRVLDAGQCNDSYSLAVIALKLKEIFGLDDVNDLPIDFDIAWYEQKALTVLLALLALGFKGVRIGPTLPAFVSPNVAKVLVETFGLKLITTVDEDVAAIVGA